MTRDSSSRDGGFSGLNNMATSLDEAGNADEAMAELVGNGPLNPPTISAVAGKGNSGRSQSIKSFINQNLFKSVFLIVVLTAAASSFLWWPVLLNFQQDREIKSVSLQLESFDRELWGKSKNGTDPKWTVRFAEKILYGQSDEKLKRIGVLLLQRMVRSEDFRAAKSLSNYFEDEKSGALDLAASMKLKEVSLTLIDKQAKLGSAPAMWALAEMHFDGKQVELNVKRAHELFLSAAEKDPAQFGGDLAQKFKLGSSGFDQNLSDAFIWYKKSASAGGVESKAKAALAISLFDWQARKSGVPEDQRESWRIAAVKLYKEAAELGDPYSMYSVARGMLSGDKYFQGDAAQGTSWLKKAVEANEPNALILTALRSSDIGQTPIPSNVENLLLTAWKLSANEYSPKSDFISGLWPEVLEKLGVFDDGGDRLIGTIDPVRFYGWINADRELNSKQRNYRFASAKDIKLADQLTDQILSIANSKTFPNEWPRLSVDTPRTHKFVPFDGELDKATGSRPVNGYLKGDRQSFGGGLSTFTIDNTTGGNDAEVRLYLNGRQVRSMFVRVGTKFTAEKLAPGTYKMRYKITSDGRSRVYEAKEQFTLSETVTEQGTRFSRMTVTLFTVKDGNMQTEEVPLDKF